MSWEAIRGALKARIESVPGMGIVLDTEPYVLNGMDGNELLEKLAVETPNGHLYHFWIFRRPNVVPSVVLDDSRIRKLTHTVQIIGTRAMHDGNASEASFQELGIEVIANLNSGDRTFAGTAVTSGDASVAFQNITWNGKVVSNEVTVTLQVEENVNGPQG